MCAAGTGGVASATAFWFLGAGAAIGVIGAYPALMSSRAAANNHGYGIKVEITYAGYFDVEPQ